MADDSTVDEKAILKAQLDESATDDIDPKFSDIDSKAKFLNGGDHANSKVEVETSSGEDSFTGLGKEELLRYANDPFWKKVRMVLFALFWVGWVGMLVAAIVIIVLAPRCPYKPDLKWFDKQASYQIYPKSFKDTNEPGKAAKGEGVGDIKGKYVYKMYFILSLISTPPPPFFPPTHTLAPSRQTTRHIEDNISIANVQNPPTPRIRVLSCEIAHCHCGIM
jgi:hypothetical protein